MAYVEKYYHTFKTSIKDIDIEYKIEIYLEGFVGSSTEFEAQFTPIEIERIAADMFEPIRKSTATVNLWNISEGQYSEFLTAGYGDYYIKLIEDPNGTPITKWTGYNQSEIGTEPYIQPPYNSAIKFTCGLSHLDYIRFDASGTPYEGYKTIIEVLRLCTNKLNTPLGYYESVNIYEDDMASAVTDSMLAQCFVDSGLYNDLDDKVIPAVFKGWFCSDVIRAILAPFKAHMFMWDEQWNVIRVQEYNTTLADLFYRTFNANVGTESTVTTSGSGQDSPVYNITGVQRGNTDEVVFLGDTAEQEVIPPLNKILLSYSETAKEADSFSSLIINPWMGNPVGIFWYWDAIGIDTSAYIEAVIHDDAIHGLPAYPNKTWVQFDPAEIVNLVTHDTSEYIIQTKSNLPLNSGDELVLSISAVTSIIVADDTVASQYFSLWKSTLPMEIKVGSYYLVGTYTEGSIVNTSYAWSLTQGYFYVVPMFNFSWTATAGPTEPSRRDINISIGTIQATALGDAVIKVYKPYQRPANGLSVNYFFITNFQITYIDQGTEETISSVSAYTEIQEDANLYEEKLIHSDGQLGLSINSFRVDTGGTFPALTDTWNRRGYAETLGLMDLISTQLVELRGDFVRGITANLVGKINANNTLVYLVGGISTFYLINNFKWDVRAQKWRVEILELEDLTSIEPPIFGEPTYIKVLNATTPTPADPVFIDDYYLSKSVISLSNGGRLIGGDDENDLLNYV